ncbi:uncharacterized protein LOC108664433 [Hyalella azteca]|uniref:Uncharacterized protein LOC108664433 n=1 Tax=Hyalella azteca TaxID=294128 RepID=A0A979FY86_HYAAZ|nr:uncharacterized protein LOC108664433 [Hyalella azteca]
MWTINIHTPPHVNHLHPYSPKLSERNLFAPLDPPPPPLGEVHILPHPPTSPAVGDSHTLLTWRVFQPQKLGDNFLGLVRFFRLALGCEDNNCTTAWQLLSASLGLTDDEQLQLLTMLQMLPAFTNSSNRTLMDSMLSVLHDLNVIRDFEVIQDGGRATVSLKPLVDIFNLVHSFVLP